MSNPVRTAEEMREAAAKYVEDRCENSLGRALVASGIRRIPIAPGPTVEEVEATVAGLISPQLLNCPPGIIGRAVLALCGGETRERWKTWEEAAIAARKAVADNINTRSLDECDVCAVRAVLAKAPPREP